MSELILGFMAGAALILVAVILIIDMGGRR